MNTSQDWNVITHFVQNARGCEVKFMLRYKMETGRRKVNNSQALYPLRYITSIRAYLAQELVYSMELFQPVSDNPYFSFFLDGCKAGDRFLLEWTDNNESAQRHETVISWYVPPTLK